jgi:hypothetical protein
MDMRSLHNYVTSTLKPPTCQLTVYHTRPSIILFYSSDNKHHKNIARIE